MGELYSSNGLSFFAGFIRAANNHSERYSTIGFYHDRDSNKPGITIVVVVVLILGFRVRLVRIRPPKRCM